MVICSKQDPLSRCEWDEYCDYSTYKCNPCKGICAVPNLITKFCQDMCPVVWRKLQMNLTTTITVSLTDAGDGTGDGYVDDGMTGAGQNSGLERETLYFMLAGIIGSLVIIVLFFVLTWYCILLPRRRKRMRYNSHGSREPLHLFKTGKGMHDSMSASEQNKLEASSRLDKENDNLIAVHGLVSAEQTGGEYTPQPIGFTMDDENVKHNYYADANGVNEYQLQSGQKYMPIGPEIITKHPTDETNTSVKHTGQSDIIECLHKRTKSNTSVPGRPTSKDLDIRSIPYTDLDLQSAQPVLYNPSGLFLPTDPNSEVVPSGNTGYSLDLRSNISTEPPPNLIRRPDNTTSESAARFNDVMRAYDGFDARLGDLPFARGCMIGNEQLQVFVTADGNLSSYENRVRNALPSDVPPNVIVVEQERRPQKQSPPPFNIGVNNLDRHDDSLPESSIPSEYLLRNHNRSMSGNVVSEESQPGCLNINVGECGYEPNIPDKSMSGNIIQQESQSPGSSSVDSPVGRIPRTDHPASAAM